MIKKRLTIEGMHCTSCSLLIEGELEDIGVKANCNYAKSVVDVEFDEANISDEDLIQAIKKAGYTVR